MDSTPFLIYSFLSPVHFENVDLYRPSDEYSNVAEKELTADWLIGKKGFWTSCTPKGSSGPEHGWKIHVSTTMEHARETLAITARELSATNTPFKFCSDPRMLRMSFSKAWSRFQTGKFITIYPRTTEQFKEIVDRIYEATKHLVGPHILTDRAYRDSRVLYYRYGAFAGKYRCDVYGRNIAGFVLDDGTWCEDIRGPSFRLPPGQSDPFADEHTEIQKDDSTKNPGPILLNDRYLVKGALKFNATGGIYFGVDTKTDQEIIIREVRGLLGHLESETPEDPAFILRREARILQKLSTTGFVPRYIDLFQEWNHWFLVVERLDAISLWGHSMEFYFSDEDQRSSFGLHKILSTIQNIARGLQAIHDRGIVLRDLTRNNVMFTKADGSVKFIDLELAYESEEGGRWINGATPGYASIEQAERQKPTPQDDHYALGVLILDMLTFCASGLDLVPANILNKMKLVLSDLGLPMQLHDIVVGLTDKDLAKRWGPCEVISHLSDMAVSNTNLTMLPAREELLEVNVPLPILVDQIRKAEKGLVKYLNSSLDLSRNDRLWPAAPELFVTNPISIQYGATGIAWFLLRSQGEIDPDILDWIEQRTLSHLCPPGLYSGLGGVALLLLYAGRTESAHRQMVRITNDPLTFDCPGLYYGSSGWGLVNLHFWSQSGEIEYLETAKRVGNRLVEEAIEDASGIYWPSSDGRTYLGFGDGQSGIALFMTYLAAATGDSRFLVTARRALEFDVAHSLRVAGRVVWKVHTQSKEQTPNLPHTRFGSAGVGAACIRYFALTGDDRFREIALDCAHTVRSRMSNKIWQDEGGAGYGEFFLDLAFFLDDSRFRDVAYYQAEAIVIHALEYPEGTAFAGADHYRVCCDYSSGGAGIGMFFDRLLNEKPRFLMLDDLLMHAISVKRRARSDGESTGGSV